MLASNSVRDQMEGKEPMKSWKQLPKKQGRTRENRRDRSVHWFTACGDVLVESLTTDPGEDRRARSDALLLAPFQWYKYTI